MAKTPKRRPQPETRRRELGSPVVVSLRLPQPLLARLTAYLESHGGSRSSFVANAIAAALDRNDSEFVVARAEAAAWQARRDADETLEQSLLREGHVTTEDEARELAEGMRAIAKERAAARRADRESVS